MITSLHTALVPAVLFLGGCTAIVHDAVVNAFPEYGVTMRSAPQLPPGNGRVVIFYPRLPMAGFNPVPLSGGGYATVKVIIDKMEQTSVGDQTFVFIDLPAGRHTVSYTRGGLLANTYDAPFDVRAGRTTFVEIISEQFEQGPAKVVSSDEALKLLANTHHNFKEPLPFNQQTRGALRAM